MLHPFTTDITGIPFPRLFTNPFRYTPHPLCVLAADEVRVYLKQQIAWQAELQRGKMLGVLVVRNKDNRVGFLAAFSGNLAGSCCHLWFVPPVFDLSGPGGFFRPEEENISAINRRIEDLLNSSTYGDCLLKRDEIGRDAALALALAKDAMKVAKAAREAKRLSNSDDTVRAVLIRESQFQKAELKRLERHWKDRIEMAQAEVAVFEKEIERLKAERKSRSAALQLKLFRQFRLLNARGETIDLPLLFEQTVQKTPPAGAGECAAPKLLQYAYREELQPVAMAEFWWGDSPGAELRRHGYFYPACKGKCEPILGFMLQGLEVDGASDVGGHASGELETVYEDEWLLVVNKPPGLLSVPGKTDADSVYCRMRVRYPEATGPLVVHRLDMATSGLLLVAKTEEVHRHLQMQFMDRTICKCYTALLDGLVAVPAEGIINLPLCPDISDRPRQMVSFEYGKTAITFYRILGYENGAVTRIAFYPRTGRTHQLRVHAAHPQGLNTPIVGDELYGKAANRLCLHAESLEFRHPVSGETIRLERKAEFL